MVQFRTMIHGCDIKSKNNLSPYLVPSLSKHCNKSRDLTFYGPSIRLDSVYPACQTNFLSHNIELTAIIEITILLY